MKVEASSIQELFEKCGDQRETMIELDDWMQKNFPDLERSFFDGSSITMIGYGHMTWRTGTDGRVWPLIGLAPQKGTTNLYVGGSKEGKGIPNYYKSQLGKVSVGKSCIRVRNTANLNFEGFKEVVRESISFQKRKEVDNQGE